MTNLFALLVGINTWDPASRVRPLRGCLNDTQAVQTFLLENLNVPPGRVRVLRDAEATRDGIMAAFREHLIENTEIQTGDQILFHYSGHGARVRDLQGIEPDGYHESLVAYDSRTTGKCDLLDKELGDLLDQLAAAKGPNITVILDSCHSGSGTRDLPVDESTPLNREIEPDERPLPPEVAAKVARLAGGARSVTPSIAGWLNGEMPYVLLSGCRDEQLSREYEGSPTVWNGALTYFTLEYLKRMPSGATYRDLHETVASQVNGLYRSQEPQCEGQRDREIFGGVSVDRYPFISVTRVEGARVHLNGGIVHDLREGTELDVYAPEVRSRAELGALTPLARVRVTATDVTSAQAEVIAEPGAAQALAAIPQFARAVITVQAFNPNLQNVALLSDGNAESDAAVEALRAAITGSEGQAKASVLLAVVETTGNPPLLVKAINGQYHIYDGDGNLLLQPVDFARAGQAPGDGAVGAMKAREGLEAIARHHAVLNLQNEESAMLDGKITVSLREILPGSNRTLAADTPEPRHADGSLHVSYDADEQKLYAVDVRNDSGETLFANVFLLTSDFGIYRLYPNKGQTDSLSGSGGTLTVGLRKSGEAPIGVSLQPEQISTTEHLKVILTPEPTDLAGLRQEALAIPGTKSTRGFGSFLDGLIDTVDGARGLKPVDFEDEGLPWTALTVPVRVVRMSDKAELVRDQESVPLGEESIGITLEKPPGLTGTIKVTTIEQEVRSLGDVPTLPVPASLMQSGYAMVERPGARSTDPARLMLEIEVENEDARRSVTPATPMRLHLGALGDSATDFIPVYFDGEDFLPAGFHKEGAAVVLTHLPPVAALPEGDAEARGLGNAIKLYLFNKKLGRVEKNLGLHAVEVDQNLKVTRKPLPGSFKAGDRVCLFVHGFTSDSESIVPAPYQMLERAGKQYDHYLSFDYESFGTSVPDNARNLSAALRQGCGLHKDDGVIVHVIAHSMGGFTTRHFVEGSMTKGYEIVDKVILAGAPNNGTPLATLANGGFWVAAFLLNHLPGIPFGGALGELVSGFHEDMAGLQDLKVGSPAVRLLKELGALPVPYLVLTGENNPAEQSRWQALAHKVVDRTLDQIFGEENDAVIGISSLRAVGVKDDPNLSLPDPFACNHSAYFTLPEVTERVRVFL